MWSRREFLVKCGSATLLLNLLPTACRPTGLNHPTDDGETKRTAMRTAGTSSDDDYPAYLKLHRTGELRARADLLWDRMKECTLCPRNCRAARHRGMRGFCRAPGTQLIISSYHPHFGEERPLVGRGGSGTIFFTHCNLRCVFCQNWEISQVGHGEACSTADLSNMMLTLQRRGCHNINLVTPTHYLPHILRAVDMAAEQGLRIPLVYNTCGWEKPEIIRQLDGIVDIYLPDFKYSDADAAARYSSEARSYPEITQQALLEMHRQVGVAHPDFDGIMRRGLMIRHLVMPNLISNSLGVIEWIARNLPKDTYVNIMAQYNPCYKAFEYRELARRITREEYRKVVNRAKELGLTNLDIQGSWWL